MFSLVLFYLLKIVNLHVFDSILKYVYFTTINTVFFEGTVFEQFNIDLQNQFYKFLNEIFFCDFDTSPDTNPNPLTWPSFLIVTRPSVIRETRHNPGAGLIKFSIDIHLSYLFSESINKLKMPKFFDPNAVGIWDFKWCDLNNSKLATFWAFCKHLSSTSHRPNFIKEQK